MLFTHVLSGLSLLPTSLSLPAAEASMMRQDAHLRHDLDMRGLASLLLQMSVELHAAGITDPADTLRALVTFVDDKTAYNLYAMSHDTRAGLERYIVNLNGQVNARTGLMRNYICPPWAGSKNSGTICTELFLNCVQVRRSKQVQFVRAQSIALR